MPENMSESDRVFILIDENAVEHEQGGVDFEDAALRFADKTDPSNDMYIASSDRGEDFFIKDMMTGETRTIRISGEQTIEYSVEEL